MQGLLSFFVFKIIGGNIVFLKQDYGQWQLFTLDSVWSPYPQFHPVWSVIFLAYQVLRCC